MLAPGKSNRLTGLALLLLFLIWLISYLLRTRDPLFTSHVNRQHDAILMSLDDFLEDWLKALSGPLPAQSSISLLCNRTDITWRPNLILRLADANGGIGNVRGNILDFLYFAISAGASIVLPSFAARSASDISALWGGGRSSFKLFFDEEYFITTMAASCPKVVIYDAQSEIKLTEASGGLYEPKSMRSDLNSEDTPRLAMEKFYSWMQEKEIMDERHGIDGTKVIELQRTLWDGPDTRSLPDKFRRDFGGLMRLNSEARRLAGIVIYNLARRYDLHINPQQPVYPNAFFGAHLRTESDAKNAGWLNEGPHLNYTGQSSTYLKQAQDHNLGIIYCASGSADELARFTVDAWSTYGISVTHKADLLSDDDLFDLQQLSWDQQALVDYEVMTRSTYFAGMVMSSFSYNIAIRRNIISEDMGSNEEQHWYLSGETDETLAFQDGLSTVWGRNAWHEMRIPRGMWP